jgi:2',3'-cyclic-nucleotide 2'-phosphodiesterase (5'-nucleotidase family)
MIEQLSARTWTYAVRGGFPNQNSASQKNPAWFYPAVDSFRPSASAPSKGENLRIVYNGDTHEKFRQEPHIITALNTEAARGRQVGKDVLTLNAGDNNVGREPDEWRLTVQMLNQAHYDAVTMGNHEFDTGSQGYADGLWRANFPTLVSNLEIEPGTALDQLVKAGRIQTGPRIIQSGNGIYGLIGVTTPDLHEVVSSTARLQGEEADDLEETVRRVQKQVNDLQRQGVDKIIVLSHMGLPNDRLLARQVSGIDVIVGGHTHEVINGVTPGYNYVQGADGAPVLILQAGKNAEWFGVADVSFDASGRIQAAQNTLLSPMSYPANPQAVALRNSVLGVPRPLAIMGNAYDCNGSEYHSDALAQFTADAIRGMTHADIALVRSPTLRSNFDPGVLTDQDLKALMPFTDTIVTLPLTGAELLEALNRSARGIATRQSHPGMLHASGLRVKMDGKTGQVQEVLTFSPFGQWVPLNPNQVYRVAVDQFAVSNREFPSLSHPERVMWNSGQPQRWFFQQALLKAAASGQPVFLQDDGRLQISQG